LKLPWFNHLFMIYFIRERKRYLMRKFNLATLVFLFFIALYGIANLLNPNKPTISLQENRNLAKKPIFTSQALLSGQYFKDWNNYYSDTILHRESLIKWNIEAKKHFGSNKNDISIVIVGNKPSPTPQASKKPSPSTKPSESPSQSLGPLETTSPSPEPSPTQTTKPEPPEEPEQEAYGAATGMYITIDGETFKLDEYSEDDYENYANYINKVKEMAGDDMEVYSMLAPSRSTYLALTKYDFLASKAANIAQINNMIDPRVKNVNVLRSMVEHVNEYIYYRTDHHWTPLGAYYGYVELMKSMGRENEVIPLDAYDTFVAEGYLGYYNKPYLTQADYDNPDKIIAYLPFVDYTYTYHWADYQVEKTLINPERIEVGKDYYLLFSDGGFGTYSEIVTDVDTDRVCLVKKDSFGDSLISFLLPHYKKIYVVDARTYDKSHCDNLNLIDFAKSKGVNDFIVNYWITEITYRDDFMVKAYSTLD